MPVAISQHGASCLEWAGCVTTWRESNRTQDRASGSISGVLGGGAPTSPPGPLSNSASLRGEGEPEARSCSHSDLGGIGGLFRPPLSTSGEAAKLERGAGGEVGLGVRSAGARRVRLHEPSETNRVNVRDGVSVFPSPHAPRLSQLHEVRRNDCTSPRPPRSTPVHRASDAQASQ